MLNIITAILEYNAHRDPERLAMKYAAMRGDAFSFLRGSCHLFHTRLPEDKSLYRAPLAWTCGDMHLENFGSYKGDNRLCYFDINDFDEATLAPCTWPVLRLLSSILVAAPVLGLDPEMAREMAHTALHTYAEALSTGKARWIERETADGEIRRLLDSLRERTRINLLDRRTEMHGKNRRIRLDTGKALPVTERQREKVSTFMAEFAHEQPDPRFFKVIDVARRVSGLGSLGLDRYVVLVRGKGSPDGNYLLDLKAAQTSSLTPCLKTPEPRWRSEAERIVSLQAYMQAIPVALLHAVEVGKKPFILREMQASEDRVNLAHCAQHPLRMEGVIKNMAELLAWSQLRSSGRKGAACMDELIEFAERKKWRARTLELAQECADRVEEDWHAYTQAYDKGVFSFTDTPHHK